MARTPSFKDIDKALVVAAGLAAKSAKLSSEEKQELQALAVKGETGLAMVDRARCAWLIRKAGPEKLPKLPKRARRLLGLPAPGEDSTEPSAPLRRIDPAVDPLDRLEKLGGLRGKPLTEAQFDRQRSKILADPAIGIFGTDDGLDPLDRVTRVGELEAADLLTSDQAADLTDRILDAA
jgi:hypothetical protein